MRIDFDITAPVPSRGPGIAAAATLCQTSGAKTGPAMGETTREAVPRARAVALPGAAAAALLGSALAASGHPGHVTHVAGHDHWLAALALAVAGALAGLAVLRGLRRRIAAPLPTSKLQAD